MSNGAVNSILLTLSLAGGLMGQTSPTTPSAADSAIDGLRQIARELNDSIKSFYVHLDQTIARHDHGYRTENGHPVQDADVDLIGGSPDVTWVAIQKFVSFRMLAARAGGSPVEEPAAADLEHIQQLILEARKRVDASTAVLRRLLVVSVVDFGPRDDAAAKARHDQLLKARAGAESMATRAILALPLEQPEAGASEETAQKAWDSLGRDIPAKTAPPLPIAFERRKRVTLVNEISYRMAVTDSGIEDNRGRHVFYQEEWAQRGPAVIRYRWRVAVEMATGEHILLKRYPPRELHGALDELYGHRDRDYIWYLEPPEDSTEPTREAIESALAEVANSREAVRTAMRNFSNATHEALVEQDRSHAAANEPPVDSGLPDALRERLFAIRAHLAHVPAFLESERAVRSAVSEAEATVRDLEPLAAWSNQTPNQTPPRTLSPSEWAQVLERSDWEIDSLRNAETEALRRLPPDSTRAEDQFPALENNVIIRIRRSRSKNPEDNTVHCLQEVWRMAIGPVGTREVRRIVSLVLIDPQTGNQSRTGGATKYYKASSGDILEEIFDEYAADEVRLGS
jgi:hypothetical protein